MFLVARHKSNTDLDFLNALKYFWVLDTKTINKIVCPVCGKHSLASGGTHDYETLSEHVCNPNYEGSNPRPTLVCNNPECLANGAGFWDVVEFGWFSNKGFFHSGAYRFGDQSYPGDILIPNRNFVNRSQYRKGVYVGRKDNWVYDLAVFLRRQTGRLWSFNKKLRTKYHINICPLWTRREEAQHARMLKRFGITPSS